MERSAIRLGVSVVKDASGMPVQEPFGLSLYHGPMFSAAHESLPVHSRTHQRFRVLEVLLAELEHRYDRLSFCAHYDVEDTRGFSWFHYHQPQLGTFRTEVLYTGILDLNAWPTFEDYVRSIRSTRRYEQRRGIAAGLSVEASVDLDLLIHLYRATFMRQRLTVADETIRALRRIAGASLARDWAELLVCRDLAGEPLSATLFLRDGRSAYYLIGANDPAHRRSGAGTLLMLENIRRCYQRGLRRVDMVGINSPKRGDFKTSFQARPVPYFALSWQRPSA